MNTAQEPGGVYVIRNTITGEEYVGASSHLPGRHSGHLCTLRKNRHHSKSLQESFNLHGESAFSIEVLEECRPEVLAERESSWIEKRKPVFNVGKAGAGLTPGGDGPNRHVVNISDEMQVALVKFCETNFVKRQTEGVRMLLGKALKGEGLL